MTNEVYEMNLAKIREKFPKSLAYVERMNAKGEDIIIIPYVDPDYMQNMGYFDSLEYINIIKLYTSIKGVFDLKIFDDHTKSRLTHDLITKVLRDSLDTAGRRFGEAVHKRYVPRDGHYDLDTPPLYSAMVFIYDERMPPIFDYAILTYLMRRDYASTCLDNNNKYELQINGIRIDKRVCKYLKSPELFDKMTGAAIHWSSDNRMLTHDVRFIDFQNPDFMDIIAPYRLTGSGSISVAWDYSAGSIEKGPYCQDTEWNEDHWNEIWTAYMYSISKGGPAQVICNENETILLVDLNADIEEVIPYLDTEKIREMEKEYIENDVRGDDDNKYGENTPWFNLSEYDD